MHGLTAVVHPCSRKGRRDPVAADPLLYEWSLRKGALLVVDNRKVNVEFLRANLKRRWSMKPLYADRRYVFQLNR